MRMKSTKAAKHLREKIRQDFADGKLSEREFDQLMRAEEGQSERTPEDKARFNADMRRIAERERSQIPLKFLMHEGRQFGIIFGPEKFIITNSEFIHSINDNSESITLLGGYPDYKEHEFTLSDLRREATVPMNLGEFGHYWGIKNRMRGNYALLLKSMKEIGVSAKAMPGFGQ